jgi:hypothetical protein
LRVEPASGQVGSVVSILGERMLGGGDSISRVLLAGTAASIVSGNDTIIVVEAAAASIPDEARDDDVIQD